MTKEKLAKQLDECEYGDEITPEQIELADQSGLLVVFGYSDDNVEFRGAFEGEVGAYESGVIPFVNTGILPEHDDSCECNFCGYKEAVKKAHILDFEFKNEGWKFSTKLPHAKFTVKEDGGIYGEGLVIELPK